MRNQREFLVGAFAVAIALSACGEADKKPAAVIDSGTDAGGDGDGDGDDVVTLACGKLSCTAPELDLSSLGPIGVIAGGAGGMLDVIAPQVCCAGKDEDLCGATNSLLVPDMTCLEQNQEGKPDAK